MIVMWWLVALIASVICPLQFCFFHPAAIITGGRRGRGKADNAFDKIVHSGDLVMSPFVKILVLCAGLISKCKIVIRIKFLMNFLTLFISLIIIIMDLLFFK